MDELKSFIIKYIGTLYLGMFLTFLVLGRPC